MTLPSHARQVLAALELISNGSTTAFDSSGHGKPESKAPKGAFRRDEEPAFVFFRRKMLEEPHRVDHWVGLAEEELAKIRGLYAKPEPVPEREGDRRARMLKVGEGWEIAKVAAHFNTTQRDVREVRGDARDPQRDLAYGRPLTDAEPDRERVLRLAGQGVSTRDIERVVSVSRPTLMKWIREQAA